MKWDIVYRKAIEPDGSLLFPERLSHEFLAQARRTMGSYLFANQYQNEIIPDDEKRFKAHWLKYFKTIPFGTSCFAFIDPAIGQHKRHDYTGIVVVEADHIGDWYVRLAKRERLTPTEIIEKMFEIHQVFKPQTIGVEIVAYQEALLYFLDQEMRKRKIILPVKGVKRSQQSKETRILGLVPRFEWGRINLAQGMTDFEDEYSSFPRGSHDDILDALASLEEIITYPEKKEPTLEQPTSQSDPNYEKWYIQNLSKHRGRGD
jgi:predicted phage terminase large subunit-like protein